MSHDTALFIHDLRKTYAGGEEALRGISLEVRRGDFFALLGSNGAGKSTTIGIICSLVLKSSGEVRIFDIDIDENFSAARMNIGVVPQEFNFNNFERVFDILVTQAGYYGVPRRLAEQRAEKYLRRLDLWDKRAMPAIQLSGGMRRRLLIARALLHEPRLLILDEPTAGVDIELRHSMWDFMRELNAAGTTIIMTTHYLEEAEQLCRSVAIIDKGRIVHNGEMREVLTMLSRQVFVLELPQPLSAAPELPEFRPRLVDGGAALEASLDKGVQVNRLFAELDRLGIAVTSVRPKVNRLEEMYMSFTASAAEEAQPS